MFHMVVFRVADVARPRKYRKRGRLSPCLKAAVTVRPADSVSVVKRPSQRGRFLQCRCKSRQAYHGQHQRCQRYCSWLRTKSCLGFIALKAEPCTVLHFSDSQTAKPSRCVLAKSSAVFGGHTEAIEDTDWTDTG
jgi:hypothetical protein